jgi:ankyrin repeat protein
MFAAKHTPIPETITFLLDRGADPQIRDQNYNRAIDYARENKNLANTEALKRLEEASRIKVIR